MSRASQRAVEHDHAPTVGGDRCDECGGGISNDGGELVCDDCGLVVGVDNIDRGPEWRRLGEDSDTTPRAGTLVDPTRHDNGFSTRIGNERGNRSEKHGRLIRAKIAAKHGESHKVKDQGRQLRDIKGVAANLNLPQPASDDACVLFQKWHNHGSHHGHDLDAVAAAVIQVAARQHGVGIRTEELTDQFSVDRRELFNNLSRLREDLGIEIPLARPSMFVGRFVNELDGEVRTTTLAKRLANAAEDADLSGSRPSSVAAGIVYEAFRAAQWEPDRTQPEVAEVAGCSGSTVRTQWHGLQDAGVEAGAALDLQQEGDAIDAGAKHAEDVESVEASADEPVVIGATSKAATYHTADCQHVERTPDRRIKQATESQIEWHGLDECGLCQRIREVRGDE